jgi:hypothetical protein
MNVSDEIYSKMKSAIVMSIHEAVEATRLFRLDVKQIIEFDMKQSINMKNCCLMFPSEAEEMIHLQEYIFNRHCLIVDIHEQLAQANN